MSTEPKLRPDQFDEYRFAFEAGYIFELDDELDDDEPCLKQEDMDSPATMRGFRDGLECRESKKRREDYFAEVGII